MVKKQITKKQKARIVEKQKAFINAPANIYQKNGLVISRFSKHALVEDENRNRKRLSIRPEIDSVVAGDKVLWLEEHNTGVIISRLERDSVLIRENKYGQSKPVAANVTQLIIVVAIKPEISWSLLDNYLITAQYLGFKATIVLNKIDLDSKELETILETVYSPLGYEIIKITKKKLDTYNLLLQKLKDETSIFVGQSGVGKSSIIAACLSNYEDVKTNKISDSTSLGQHTTSYSTLFHLKNGADIIDSPGVRQFTLTKLTPRDIVNGYIEFKTYLQDCKFRNCNHIDTPDCGIIKALQSQKISSFRYNNFIKCIKNNN